jgi:hypothetical protein
MLGVEEEEVSRALEVSYSTGCLDIHWYVKLCITLLTLYLFLFFSISFHSSFGFDVDWRGSKETGGRHVAAGEVRETDGSDMNRRHTELGKWERERERERQCL